MLMATIHPYQFKANEEPFAVRFTLSSMDVTVPPIDRTDPSPTLGEVILEKLYKDETHEDVFFIFDSISDASASTGEPEINPDITSDSSTDDTVSLEDQQSPSMDPGKADEENDQFKPDANCAQDSGPVTIGAHKLVLCQWPYFKAMFESGFMESGAGNKEVRIKDASPNAFLQLLRFMYTGRLPEDSKPKTTYMDPLNKYTDASWESLYLLADRYKVEELIVIARAKILSKFSSEEIVPFLFRTAYLFADLREPVIKYMVESCGSIVASKSTRLDYMDHPDGVQIFGELFEQLYATQNSSVAVGTQEPDITLDSVAETDVDFGMSLDYQEEQGVGQEESTTTHEKQNKTHKNLEVSKTALGHRTQRSTAIKAHKLVLCQWPYFKVMFEGRFTESGPGPKQISIKDLDATNYIPFLFRSAYMFNELRGPVIKIVVETCGNQMAKRSIRDSYKDHPDFIDILGELFEQHHMLHDK
ncbi:hypothetical protein BG006_009803 [Podila minutissima]|uniref:BTB domain-containing protein n=1 Tax=Podila minutissima TaxID=64525 RepID=A0A9P5SGA7_9FUNG|nr:hypothetical protein BG006_009803 [Podila minutissima]